MILPSASRLPTQPIHPPAASELRPRERWLLLARITWSLIAAGMLADFLLGIQVYYARARTVCTPGRAACGFLSLPTADNARALHRLGLSLDVYAAVLIALLVVVSLVYLALGALIFWRKPHEWYGLFVALILVLFGGSFGNPTQTSVFGPLPLPFWLFLQVTGLVQWLGLPVFLLTFPSGRFAPRWTWVLVLLWVAQFSFFALPAPYSAPFWPVALFAAELLLTWGSPAVVQVYRYRRLYTAVQRQQTKWVVFGFALGVLVFVLASLLGAVVPGLNAPDSPYQLLGGFWTGVLYVSISLSVGIAILRYRLWDIDTIINKALVYGSLTALLGALYAGLIIGLESLVGRFTGQASQPLVIVLSTLAIATLFLPLRRRIQALIDRRFYRRKYDAAKTLAAFSATLRNEVDLNELRAQVLAVVQETMQPAHASLWLRPPERQRMDRRPGEGGQP
jgi:hypothetical protein